MRERKWVPGSAAVYDYVLRPGGLALSAAARLLYAALFSRVSDGFECWPSLATLAAGTGLSIRTIQRKLDELEQAGLFCRRQVGRYTKYRLNPPWQPNRRPDPAPDECGTDICIGDTMTTNDAMVASDDDNMASMPVTVTNKETQRRNPYEKPKEEVEEGNEPVAFNDPLVELEAYVAGRTRRLVASSTDVDEMRYWLRLTNGDLAAVKAGIDEGLRVFQEQNPGDHPMGARWYSGFVIKQWQRQSGGGQRAGNPGSRAATIAAAQRAGLEFRRNTPRRATSAGRTGAGSGYRYDDLSL